MTAAEKLKLDKLVLTSAEYFAHPAVGSSSLKKVLRSPAHYLYEKENPQEPTPAMNFGTACHTAHLEPNTFQERVAVMPKFEGTGMRAKQEQWRLENHGKTIIKAEELADIYGMLKSVSKHQTARGLLTGGASEESYFSVDPDTGLAIKARPDFLRNGNTIVDLKTTINAEPETFVKSIANFQYHLSAALYLDVVSAVMGQTFTDFVIIAVEKDAPYGVSVHLLDEAAIEEGRKLYKKALKTLAECQKTNTYPAYPDKILSATLPNWAYTSEHE